MDFATEEAIKVEMRDWSAHALEIPNEYYNNMPACPYAKKAWAKRPFDTYPSAYANLAASKYCKDPNYAKKSKGGKRRGR